LGLTVSGQDGDEPVFTRLAFVSLEETLNRTAVNAKAGAVGIPLPAHKKTVIGT
jgi:hypothetical protein